MADLEARREARRRKILQNSENRMNRLLGKSVVPDEGPNQTSSSSEAPEQIPHPERTEFSLGSSTPADRHVPLSAGDTNLSTPAQESQTSTETVRQRLHRSTPGTGTENEIGRHIPRLPVSPSGRSVKIAKNGEADGHKNPESASGQMRLLDLLRCGGCLLTAFLTRWALKFGLGLLFMEWVMIPFVVLEGSLLYFQFTYMKDLQLPHKSSMMTYALVLSGVRHDLIMKYDKIMGCISAIAEDFALFLFTFLVCNAVVT